MTQEELDALKVQKFGGGVAGTSGQDGAAAKSGDGATTTSVDVSRGNTQLGGNSTAVFDQRGSNIVRLPDRQPSNVMPTQQGGFDKSADRRYSVGGLEVSFPAGTPVDTIQESQRFATSLAEGRRSPEGQAAFAKQHEQFLDREHLKNTGVERPVPIGEGQLYTRENSPSMKEAERTAYNREILSGRNQLANTMLGGNNQLENTRLSSTGRLVEQSQQNVFTGAQNDLNRGQVVEQNALNRTHDMAKQKSDIAGKAFISGIGGNQVQQIENSPADNINFAGLQMPVKQKDKSFKPIIEDKKLTGVLESSSGQVSPVESVARPEPQKRGVLGGIRDFLVGPPQTTLSNNTPQRAAQVAKLQRLRATDPEEFARLKAAANAGR